jgi:hypothetical protein
MFKTRLRFCFAPPLSAQAARIFISGATLALTIYSTHAQQQLVGQPAARYF